MAYRIENAFITRLKVDGSCSPHTVSMNATAIEVNPYSGSTGCGLAANNIAYSSFTDFGSILNGNRTYYMGTIGSTLYALPSNNGRIRESSNGGSTWSLSGLQNQFSQNETVSVQAEPIWESNRVLLIDGTDSNNFIMAWDGSSTNFTQPVSGTSTLSQIEYFQKVGSYYYVSDFAGPTERSTSLTSGWATIGSDGPPYWFTESDGTILYNEGADIYRTDDDFATTLDRLNNDEVFSGQLYFTAAASDGDSNWLGIAGGTNANYKKFSTNDGVTWANIKLTATGDTENIGSGFGNSQIVSRGGKWIWLDTVNKKLLSFSGTPTATPTLTTEYDFSDLSDTVNNLYTMNFAGNTLYITGQYDSNYGYFKFDLT